MKKSGLTISMVFEAESANYGEGFGNISTLKKISRGDGKAYSYISRQAIRYNIINQLGWDSKESLFKEGSGEKAVVQFAPNATIDKYPEIDLFGYMKTSKKDKDNSGGSTVRSAVVRLSNAIALEPFNSDLDFLTNMGLAKRVDVGNNIAQSELHKSFYTYTITVDLDRIGIDNDITIPNNEKCDRMKMFLDTIALLYRDIKGRRENLAPVFAIGGLYTRKNPFFENRLCMNKNKLNVEKILSVYKISTELENTLVGYIEGSFANNSQILEQFKPLDMGEFFNKIKEGLDEYYV